VKLIKLLRVINPKTRLLSLDLFTPTYCADLVEEIENFEASGNNDLSFYLKREVMTIDI
jgi:hypothetical protein